MDLGSRGSASEIPILTICSSNQWNPIRVYTQKSIPSKSGVFALYLCRVPLRQCLAGSFGGALAS